MHFFFRGLFNQNISLKKKYYSLLELIDFAKWSIKITLRAYRFNQKYRKLHTALINRLKIRGSKSRKSFSLNFYQSMFYNRNLRTNTDKQVEHIKKKHFSKHFSFILILSLPFLRRSRDLGNFSRILRGILAVPNS